MKSNDRSPQKSWVNRRYVLVGIVLLACLLALAVFLGPRPSRKSLAQRIAAMDARRALPPEKNAATIYDRLAATYVPAGNAADPNLGPATFGMLIEASKMDFCWFPLSLAELGSKDYGARFVPMREWARALASAAAKDIGDGRIDAAAEKLRCMVQMGRHLRQQLTPADFCAGMEIEASAWGTLCESVMRPDAPQELLRTAEAMAGDLDNDFEQAYAPLAEALPIFTKIYLAKQAPLDRIEEWGQKFLGIFPREEELEQRIAEYYLRLLSLRRGVRVLVGLQHYYNANSRLPDSLDEIKTLVPEQALIDPFTERTFVYRRVSNGTFLLYARGLNRTDENGSDQGKADDYPLWPQYGIKAP